MNTQMKRLIPDREYRIPSACGVSGIMDRSGKRLSGQGIYMSICNMKDRGNGLGSGYAAYGIYPDHRDSWCFHMMYDRNGSKHETEDLLRRHFIIEHMEPIPTKKMKCLEKKTPPLLFRYFLNIKTDGRALRGEKMSEEDFILETVMHINRRISGAFVFSSGKDMGIFKGVGDPDEIGEFYRIPDYRANIWTAHNRFPTNTTGWWGGAHPFGILDWSVVHNGEISSYGINRRYLENSGYFCTLHTDTEVITYLLDLLIRRHGLDLKTAAGVLAAPFWSKIDRMSAGKKEFFRTLRIIYGPALLNGPFGIIAAKTGLMMGLNDRVKLRPLVAGEKGDILYISSEEAAIRCVCRKPDRIWMPTAGQPVIGRICNG